MPVAITHFHDEHYKRGVYRQKEAFSMAKKNDNIWDDFMLNDRCRFYNHPTGRCWRDV